MRRDVDRLRVILIGLFCLLGLVGVAAGQSPELEVQTGHTGGILSVAFSPDGKLLASTSTDNTIKLWDVASQSQIRSIPGAGATLIAFSPDGRLLATARGTAAQLWDVASGTILRSMPVSSFSIVFSPDGKLLATSDDKVIKLWDVASGTQSLSLEGHTERVRSLAFSADGKLLVSGSTDKTIRVWNVATRSQSRSLEHSSGVIAIALSPNGKLLASATKETVKLWDLASGTELKSLESGLPWFNSIAFSPDSKFLVGSTPVKKPNGGIRFWDVASGTYTDLLTELPDLLTTVAFSPNGKLLASGNLGEEIRLWEVATKSPVGVFKRQSSAVSTITLSADGRLLASRSVGEEIKLWDMAAGGQFRSLDHSDATSLELLKKVDAVFRTAFGFFGFGIIGRLLNPIAFSPDGKLLASIRWIKRSRETPTEVWDETLIELWDVQSRKQIKSLTGADLVTTIAFSPDGKLLATDSDKITLWDVASAKPLQSLEKNTKTTTTITFSPDGKLLASGDLDGMINLWDVASGAHLRSITDDFSMITSVTFSPDGKLLASGGGAQVSTKDANTIRLWDVATGTNLKSLEGHSNTVNSVTFSTDGRLLASGSADNTVRLWDVATGSQIRSFVGHSDYVTTVVFSADQKRLISSSNDATVRIWAIDSSAPLASLTSLGKNDWLVVTPDNLFDGSAAAWRRSVWRFSNNLFDYAPVEAFFSEFFYPGLLAEIMSGRTPKANRNISEKDIRQPDVKITRSDSESPSALDVTLPTVTVEVEINEAPADAKKNLPAGGVRDVRLFRNGSLVKVWHGNVLAPGPDSTCRKPAPGRVICVSKVQIVGGENRLTAYAFNRDNVKSRDGELVIRGAGSLKRAGTLYVLAIGLNKYANSTYDLRYAVADARDFGLEMKKQQDKLKLYANTEIISLTDREASKTNILTALRRFAEGDRVRLQEGTPPSLRRVEQSRPEDAVIIYFAGHGTTDKDRFYLIPHDLGVVNKIFGIDKRTLQSLHAHSISDLELETALERIDAGQLLMFIDACNSGQALEADEKRRGPMNSKGLAQLAYEKGMYILTAAQSYQAALEVSRLGHGLLTYSLLEGLTDLRADADRNKEVWDREWMDYAMDRVPQMQVEEMRQRGAEIMFVNGDDYTLAGDKRNVQRPRVFYRREPALQPLIIARP